MKTIELKKGDACPRCGAAFVGVRIPTPEEYAKAFDKENPGSLPEGCDTASPDFRAEHGDLHRCGGCGYQTRFPADAPAGDAADAGADAPAGKGKGKGKGKSEADAAA